MLEKTFDPAAIEARQYQRSEEAGAFHTDTSGSGEPFCIMMPPPNVTGQLHIGHALTFTLQDILCRFWKMRGRKVLWQAGTDHAGIATQMVVERQLAAGGATRQSLGREKFLERVWQWKEQSGDTIVSQLRRLGASPDWSRQRFTLDEGLSKAVRTAFVQMYQQGLIYRGQRLVNWDVVFQSAISDLEVLAKDSKSSFCYLNYPLEDGSGHLTIATTRPETLFGDVAVAVHPDDERYQALIGKRVKLPLTNRTIPVIADGYTDPTKGSGVVKITPAHDFNDFAVGQRHDLPLLNILNRDGTLNHEVPEPFRGQDRLKARPAIVQALEEQGFLEKTETISNTIPTGDRSGSIIEPLLTEQWFVNAAPLAEKALAAVHEGKSRFVPKQWENTYFRWLEDIQPWCISRQLWWGHRIPAWYDDKGTIFVAESAEEAQQQAGAGVPLRQDDDVLDTWFSSALWPFSTLGWPEKTPELATFYPTTTLVTGFDIIFFWVARMMMMGLHFTGQVPFRDIYIHALVRDEHGQKMSKSKGNVIDPLQVASQYGTDALRFTLTILAAQGRDVKLSMPRVEGYRNFATKLWNAARFLEMNGCTFDPAFRPEHATQPVNRWLLATWAEALKGITEALEQYRFNDAAQGLYSFAWHTYCDWYVEFAKPLLAEGSAAQAETSKTAAFVLHALLRALHPVMPFLSDELAQQGGYSTHPLLLDAWPQPPAVTMDDDSIEALVQLISAIRTARTEVRVPAGAQMEATVTGATPAIQTWFRAQEPLLKRMARLSSITFADSPPPQSLHLPFRSSVVCLPVAGVIDMAAELARLDKELQKTVAEITSLRTRLTDDTIRKGAPAEVLEEWQERLATLEEKQGSLQTARALLAV